MKYRTDSSFNVLYTKDLQKTLNFYTTVKANIEKVEEDKIVVKFGDFELHFILNTTEPFDSYRYISNSSEYGSGNIFYIEVEDIESAPKLIIEAGGKITADIFKNKWDCKELLFEDPNGYKFAFYE